MIRNLAKGIKWTVQFEALFLSATIHFMLYIELLQLRVSPCIFWASGPHKHAMCIFIKRKQ